MQLPNNVKAVISAYVAKFPPPQGDPAAGNWDETIRQWTIRLCQQVCFSIGNQWGAKRADPGRPIGKDSLATYGANFLYSWDLLIGAGTGRPQIAADPTFYDLTGTGQVFEPVQPADYIGGGGGTPPPDPDPNPGVDTAAILAAIKALDAKVSALPAQIAAEVQRVYDQNERIFAAESAQIQSVKDQRLRITGSLRVPAFGGTGSADLAEQP